MIIFSNFKKKFSFALLFAFLSLALVINASVQRNICRECQTITAIDATHCPNCNAPLNLCLDCGTANPVNEDYCINCNAPLAEMRVLGSIDEETRERLKLGKSTRAELEKELIKLNHLIEKQPEDLEKLMFKKGKILHRMKFYSRESIHWQDFLRLFPETSKKTFVQIYLSEALRKWGYLFYQQGKKKQACELFEQSATTNRANKKAWQWLGRTHMELKNMTAAKDAYLNALITEPGDKTSLHFLRKLGAKIPEDLKNKKVNH
jgi:tetratricopeptide (TPR) repeat protein